MSTSYSDIPKIPELRKKIGFVFLILAVYRLGVFIPVPGVNRAAMSEMMGGGGVMGLVNLFSGGALEMMSIFALGIMPYISASIIMQLMKVVVPQVEKMQKEGEQGRKKITQWTRYGTVGLCAIQGTGIALYLENLNQTNPGLNLLVEPGWGFRLLTMLTLTTGTVFVMWLGEQITEEGIGNGISLIITASIIAQLPATVGQLFQKFDTGVISTFTMILIVVIGLATTAFIVFMESAQRRIPLQYAKRMVGRRIYGGQKHHLPLKVNMAGVIPPIFASSMLIFPSTIFSYFPEYGGQWIQTVLVPGDWRYNTIYSLLIIFFTYFYTAVQVNPVDMADNLKKSGAFIPGIRPGKKTADYIDEVLTRLTGAGSVYLAAVCIMPFFLQAELGVDIFLGGMSLLITVSVGLRTMDEVENQLITRHYDDFSSQAGMSGESGSIAGRDDDKDRS